MGGYGFSTLFLSCAILCILHLMFARCVCCVIFSLEPLSFLSCLQPIVMEGNFRGRVVM